DATASIAIPIAPVVNSGGLFSRSTWPPGIARHGRLTPVPALRIGGKRSAIAPSARAGRPLGRRCRRTGHDARRRRFHHDVATVLSRPAAVRRSLPAWLSAARNRPDPVDNNRPVPPLACRKAFQRHTPHRRSPPEVFLP